MQFFPQIWDPIIKTVFSELFCLFSTQSSKRSLNMCKLCPTLLIVVTTKQFHHLAAQSVLYWCELRTKVLLCIWTLMSCHVQLVTEQSGISVKHETTDFKGNVKAYNKHNSGDMGRRLRMKQESVWLYEWVLPGLGSESLGELASHPLPYCLEGTGFKLTLIN